MKTRDICLKPVLALKTECGDGLCEEEEGEACDTCPRDCGRCPLKAWQIGLIGAAAGFIILVFAGIIIVSFIIYTGAMLLTLFHVSLIFLFPL